MIRGSTLDLQRAREPSRLFDPTNPDYLRITTAAVTAPPMTLASWGYSTSLTQGQAVIFIGHDGSADNFFQLIFAGPTAGDPIKFRVRDADTNYDAVSSIPYTINRWEHSCAVAAAVDDRAVYLNGGNKGTDVVSATPAGVDVMRIGCNETGAGPFYGRLFWPCVWKCALNESQIAALGNRADPTPPWEIQPESIVSMPNMRTLWDPYMRARWTPTGTVPANPPWIWRPRHVSMYVPAAVGNPWYAYAQAS